MRTIYTLSRTPFSSYVPTVFTLLFSHDYIGRTGDLDLDPIRLPSKCSAAAKCRY
jgi:hypothetical protein